MLRKYFVGPPGIEPGLYAPEAHVLPVYYGPKNNPSVPRPFFKSNYFLFSTYEDTYWYFKNIRASSYLVLLFYLFIDIGFEFLLPGF